MTRAILRSTTALFAILVATQPLAQDAPVDDGFLGTLTATAGKRDIATGAAVATTVVDATEIADRQAGTIAELIDSVPGVTLVNGSTPQGGGINIRGFGSNSTFGSDQKVAILIDGASVGSEELYRIGTQLFTDPLLYRNVEVLRGTMGSFEYGSGVVGGVVRLETKNASDFTGGEIGFRLGQTLEFASNGSGRTSSTTLAWQPAERAEFLLNYTWRSFDDQTDGGGAVIGNSAFTTPSGLIKGKWTFGDDDAHSLTFSHSRTLADEKDVPYDQFISGGGSFGNVDRVTDTAQTVLEYGFDPASDLIDLTVNLSYADQAIDQTYIAGSSPLESNPMFGPKVLALGNADHRYQTTKLVARNTARFQTGAVAHEFRAGVELVRRDRADNAGAAGAPGGTDERLAAFVIDQMTWGAWTLTPALRHETSTVENTAGTQRFRNTGTMGGLAVAYDFGKGVSLFGSGAYTEGLPIIDDLGTTATALRRMTTMEKALTWELGASYDGGNVWADGDSLVLRANLYHTEMWDVTSYTTTMAPITDLARVTQQGLELEASYGLASGVYADLNAHIGDGTERAATGAEAVWRNAPADSVGLTLGRRFGEQLDLSWEIVHTANVRNALATPQDDYTLHNLRATLRPQTGALQGAEVRFGIENVLDVDYIGHLAARKAPGRTFKVTLTKVF